MHWLMVLDFFGVFVFALSGGFDAAKNKLDLLGVLVLSVATGVGGGIIRDVILGIHPPSVFTNEGYLFLCLFSGLIVILFSRYVEEYLQWVRIADAIGLAVFAVIGAQKAIDYNLGWVGVLMISTLTAVGGGVVRDLLLREIPMILIKGEFYAVAAMLGGAAVLIGNEFSWNKQATAAVAVLVAVSSRFLAMKFGLSLPQVR